MLRIEENRYFYLLDRKVEKIEKSLQTLREYDLYLLNNQIKWNTIEQYVEELKKRYTKRKNLLNTYRMHLRDRENLFNKYVM